MNRTAELSAGSFAYTDAGDGVPVVFIHALGKTAADWSGIVARLAATYRCLAIDLRGHGASPRTDLYTYDALVSDLEEFLSGLGLERVAIVGHSVGAVVGWLFAERHAERVLAFVAEDTGPPRSGDDYPEVPSRPPEPVSYDWEFRRQIFRQLADPDPRWWADRGLVTAPTLVVAGETDDVNLAEAIQPLPRASLSTIPVGHWIHESRPDEYGHLVRDFLADSVG